MQIGPRYLLRLSTFALSLSLPLLAGVNVLSDGTFVNADWSQVIFTQSGGATGSFAQVATGGNPDSFRAFTTDYPSLPNGGAASVILVSFGANLTHNPSVDGAVTQLDFGYDIGSISGLVGGRYRPMLRQNGIIYFLLVDDFVTTAWTNRSHTSTSAADWGETNGGLGHPDFSASGGTIEFGYRVGLTLSCVTPGGCISGTIVSGLDNYQVTITTADPTGNVPEPAFSTLSAAALIAAILWRTRGPAIRSSH